MFQMGAVKCMAAGKNREKLSFRVIPNVKAENGSVRCWLARMGAWARNQGPPDAFDPVAYLLPRQQAIASPLVLRVERQDSSRVGVAVRITESRMEPT